MLQIRTVLMSVTEKEGLVPLARAFISSGARIISTGGTGKLLAENSIPYTQIEEFSMTPEAFDGRVKTLTFNVQSAILFDRSKPEHVRQAAEMNVQGIDCVVCNFYDFESALRSEVTLDELVEKIDIGGPNMVRAAAKNFKNVLVLTDPADYQTAIRKVQANDGAVEYDFLVEMMKKAHAKVAQYTQAIDEAFNSRTLRYGENPHQTAAFVSGSNRQSTIQWDWDAAWTKDLSYNNILDTHAAVGVMVDALSVAPAGHSVVSIIKHCNPCGFATGPSVTTAFERAWEGDPVSAFGGIVAFSSRVTRDIVNLLSTKFIEVLAAPDFEPGVLEDLMRMKKKLRIVKLDLSRPFTGTAKQRTTVDGGYLVQDWDTAVEMEHISKTRIQFPSELWPCARFGIVASKWVKSNAITLVRPMNDGGMMLVGMGSGQPNRVDSIQRLAIPRAIDVIKDKAQLSDCVLVSDAFFPFSDSIEMAKSSGVKYIVQPGGSIRDEEVMNKCNELGVAMAITGKRHFKH